MTQPGGRQLIFDLPHRVALGREDFLVTDSNAKAVALVDAWPNWPASAMVLAGPAGSGKTHLTEIWCQTAGAARVAASAVTESEVPSLSLSMMRPEKFPMSGHCFTCSISRASAAPRC
jgi:chromosomal replication initiation ATPase DnaA